MNELHYLIQKIFNAIFNKDILIEIFKTLPAWIALAISILAPLVNKKLEIEKTKVNFLFSKRYDIFEKHFKKLYELRNATINLLACMMFHFEHENYNNLTDINSAKNDLYKQWQLVKESEASLWLLADYSQLQLKVPISNSIKLLFEKINSLTINGVLNLNKSDIEELIQLAKELQNNISQILDNYRQIFSLKDI